MMPKSKASAEPLWLFATKQRGAAHPGRTIDVDSSEAEVLFEILDLSGDGSIDKEATACSCAAA